MARVRALEASDLIAAHRTFADALDAGGGFINVYRAMAHSPEALQRFYGLLMSLWQGALSPRQREIAILSVVAASEAQYPLGWHVLDAADAGLSDAEIRAAIDGDVTSLPPDDAAIVRYSRTLTADANADDATFAAVADTLDERQLVELTLLAGLYRMVACVANALDVELEEEPARALASLR